MQTDEFTSIVKSRTEKISQVLASKAAEYATEDRLANFKRAAGVLDMSPERACIAFYTKHFVSIMHLIEDLEAGKPLTKKVLMFDEKIGDAINYLILLEALLIERISPSAGPTT